MSHQRSWLEHQLEFMIDILGMKVSKELVPRKKGLATTMVFKLESRERLLTASRQKVSMK